MLIRLVLASLVATLISAAGSLAAQAPDGPPGGSSPIARTLPALALAPPESTALRTGLDVVERALALSRDSAHAEAARHYLTLVDHIPALADWAPLFAAEELAELGDTTGVRTMLARLPADSEVGRGWGWLASARGFEAAGDTARAFEAARASEPDVPGAPSSLRSLRVGELALARSDTATARSALVRSMVLGEADRFAVRAADILQHVPRLTPAERFRIGRTRVAQDEIVKAIDGLEAWTEIDDLEDDERGQARLDLARAYFAAHRYADTRRVGQAILDEGDSGAAVSARALYWVGRAVYRQGDRERGRSTLEAVAERFPGQRAAGDALYLLAELDRDADRTTAAQAYYRRILDVDPDSRTADVAGMRLGSMDYFDGQYDRAAALFDRRRVEAGSESARQEAAYWSGLSYTSLGHADTAQSRFLEAYAVDPLTYYGAHAAARTGVPLLLREMPEGPVNGPDVREGELANAVARLRVHMRVPTPGSFAYELARIEAHFAAREGGSYALAEALIAGGLPIQGILLGRRLQRATEEGWNVRLLRIIYPFPHREIIVREASARDVNPYFVAGLIRQESMFDEDIESRAGAIGIMQVMPATGSELARSLGITPFSPARLAEAEVNVRIGMTFLAEMLRRYDGAVLDALVAYNAGPTRIRRWRAYPEYGNPDVFMERIPFRETREYVKIVQQNALIYESLYGCGAGDPCLGAAPRPVQAYSRGDEALR